MFWVECHDIRIHDIMKAGHYKVYDEELSTLRIIEAS